MDCPSEVAPLKEDVPECNRKERPAMNLPQPQDREFEYTPLASTHIRILKAQMQSELGPDYWTLDCVSRSDAKKLNYTAISYRWDPNPPTSPTIFLNGCQRSVALNLYNGLRVLRSHGVQALWNDQLCINQNDKHEKEDQIQGMELTYSDASQVIVWLGDDQDDSEYVMQTISRRKVHDYKKKRFLVGLLKILNREWFARTWIIQEFVLSRTDPLIACGPGKMVSWTAFLDAYETAYPFVSKTQSELCLEHRQALVPLIPQFQRSSGVMVILRSLRNGTHGLRKNGSNNAEYRLAKYNLAYILRATRPFLATDPCDKIYGVLGMTHESSRCRIRTKGDTIKEPKGDTIKDLFACATTVMLQHERSAGAYGYLPVGSRILVPLNGPSEKIPSWIPNFNEASEESPFMPAGQLQDWKTLGEGKDGGRVIPCHIQLSDCGDKLTVKGLILDEVRHIIKAPSAVPRTNPLVTFAQFVTSSLSYLFQYYRTRGLLNTLRDLVKLAGIIKMRPQLIEYCKALVKISRWTSEHEGSPNLMEPLWKTLLSAESGGDRYSDERDCQDKFDALLALCRSFAQTERHSDWFVSPSRLTLYFGQFPLLDPLFSGIRENFIPGRYFFGGEEWYGVGEGKVRRGDKLALLFPDANVPFILRLNENLGDYEMIGVANVPHVAKDAAAASQETIKIVLV